MYSRKLQTHERPKYESVLLVTLKRGRAFPIDMLRYDNCRPYHEADSRKIEQSFVRAVVGDESDETERQIRVIRQHDVAQARWTPGRWLSYGAERVEEWDRSEDWRLR